MEQSALSLTRRAATAGADLAAEHFRDDVAVRTKAHKNDLVSEVDRRAQERVVETIRAESDARIVAEEDDATETVPESGRAWVVDPIDGTANYLRGLRIWGTSVAAVDDGEPVAAATVMPSLGDSYLAGDDGASLNGDPVTVSERGDVETFAVAVLGWGAHGSRSGYARLAERVVRECGDMRRFGCMQAALSFVATGGLEAAVTAHRPSPWDSMAGVHLVRRAGGRVTDVDGDRWRHDSKGLVATNGVEHEAVLATVQAATNG